jgi:tetratricopeptide (TPR) repeat protein
MNHRIYLSAINFTKIIFVLTIIFFINNESKAQQQWKEKPKNLKVLPENINGEELRVIMQGFTGALSVKCNYCHEDSKGPDFGPMDYSSDVKKEKQVARTMISMVNTINTNLLKISRGIESDIGEVSCVTCHRGAAHIDMLEDVLFGIYKRNGLDAAFNRYNELRKRYYGSYTYDFRDHALLSFSSKVSEAGNADDALAIVLKNCELFPESSVSYSFLGDFYVKKSDNDKAIKSFEKALQLDPNNRFANSQLKKLKNPVKE